MSWLAQRSYTPPKGPAFAGEVRLLRLPFHHSNISDNIPPVKRFSRAEMPSLKGGPGGTGILPVSRHGTGETPVPPDRPPPSAFSP